MLFTDLAAAGVNLRMVNLGGGYPVRYRDEIPGIDRFADAIMGAMTEHFGNDLPEILVEPGRFLVGDAGVISTEVVLVCHKAKDDPVRWVYLDIGRFGGLAETEGESIKYRFETPHDGGETGPVAIAGPTCDGADILYERANYRLPLALRSRRAGQDRCPPAPTPPPTPASASTASPRWPNTTSDAVFPPALPSC